MRLEICVLDMRLERCRDTPPTCSLARAGEEVGNGAACDPFLLPSHDVMAVLLRRDGLNAGDIRPRAWLTDLQGTLFLPDDHVTHDQVFEILRASAAQPQGGSLAAISICRSYLHDAFALQWMSSTQ